MQKNDLAVSPVVGVMLMLVVTIIIAALVSAFAGGTVSGTQKVPQAAILGTYSQSTGMTIIHNGGDAIPLSTTRVIVQPSRAFGADASRYSWVINKSYVTTTTQTWATARAFMPGDIVTITQKNLTYVQQRPNMVDFEAADAASTVNFMDPNNVGLTFTLAFQDTSGKTIGQTLVTITK